MTLPNRSECACGCHRPGQVVMHCQPCCRPDPSPEAVPSIDKAREALEDIATIKRSAYEAAKIAREALAGPRSTPQPIGGDALTLARHVDALGGTANPVDDVDRAAVTKFHTVQIKRIMQGDKTLGDNRDTIERAFADHRALGYSEALTDVAALLNRLGLSSFKVQQV